MNLLLLNRFSTLLLLALSLALSVPTALAQPSTATTSASAIDPYSILSSDPSVDRAVAYLKTLGASEPKREDVVVTSPGVVYVLSTLTFISPQNGTSCTVIAGLAALFPNTTANDLARNGVITLATPLWNIPVPGVNVATGKSAPALSVPQSPLGPRQFPGTPDTVGDDYYVGPYDTFPLNHMYTDPANGRI